MRKRLQRSMIAVMMGVLLLSGMPAAIYAANPFVESVSASKIMGLEYAFTFRTTSKTSANVTTSSLFTNNYNDFFTDQDAQKKNRYSHKISDNSEKGKLWIRWPYVGKYGGRDVDLKVTVMDWGTAYSDWTAYNQKTGKTEKVYPSIHFSYTNFQISITALRYVTVKYTLLYNGTETEINGLKGHGTLYDLDGNQAFGVKEGYQVDKLWIRQGNSHLSTGQDGDVYLVNSASNSLADDDELGMVTVLYRNNFMLRFYNGLQNNSNRFSYHPDTNVRRGPVCYYNFLPRALGPIEIPNPQKGVGKTGVAFQDSNQEDLERNGYGVTADSEGNLTYDYVISQEITPNDIESFVVTDTLNDCLDYQSASVVNEDGVNRTDWFQVTRDGQTVRFAAMDSSRQTTDFSNNHVYTFRIRVKVNLSKLHNLPEGVKQEGNQYYIPNRASVTINVGNRDVNKENTGTNQVWAIVTDMTGELEIVKRVEAAKLEFSSGNPAFLFRVEGTLEDGRKRILHEAAEFTEEYVKANMDSNGYVSLSVLFPNLDWGTYVVSERIAGPEYQFAGITESSGAQSVEEGSQTVTFMLSLANQRGRAVFTNIPRPGPFTPLTINEFETILAQ